MKNYIVLSKIHHLVRNMKIIYTLESKSIHINTFVAYTYLHIPMKIYIYTHTYRYVYTGTYRYVYTLQISPLMIQSSDQCLRRIMC